MLSEQMLVTVRAVFVKAWCLCSVLVCVEMNLVVLVQFHRCFLVMK